MRSKQERCFRVLTFVGVVAVAAALPVIRAHAGTPGAPAASAHAKASPWRIHAGTLRLADVVVQQPNGPPPPAAPAVAPTPVVEQPQHVVHTNVESHNYMATMAWSAIMGGVLGAVVGTAIYYLDSGERPRNIAYWAAGGVLLGTGVGLIQVAVQESRTDRAVSHAPTDPAPTLRLALYQRRF